jgi:hypothetical protein
LLTIALNGTDRIDLTINESSFNHQNLIGAGANTHAQVDAHLASSSNPHNTTKAQVGLGNVDNTADLNKPVSAAQQSAIDLKAPMANPVFTGTVTAPSYTSNDAIHTGKLELKPGTCANFATAVTSGNWGLFVDSANGNKVSKCDSSGTPIPIESGMTYPGAGIGNSTGSAWGVSFGVATTVGSPGIDANLVTEKAVRAAITASSAGMSDPGGNGMLARTALNTTIGRTITGLPTRSA